MRLYSEAEARAMLPSVIPIIEQLRDAFVRVRALQSAVAANARAATADGALIADAWAEGGNNEMDEQRQRLRAAARKLDELGIEVKDAERGLIDFYSERDGTVVYLCYLLGEPEIGFWHGLQDGFAGRQPL